MPETEGYTFTKDWVSARVPSWRNWLAPYAGRPGIRLLEIGSYEGRSTVWFLQEVLSDPTARITCIDLFEPEYEPRFDRNIQLSGAAAKVTKLKGPSFESLWTLAADSFDIAYVDGSHDAADVLMDAGSAFRALKVGGTMVLDDYRWKMRLPERQRPRVAIDLLVNLLGRRCELVEPPYAQACLRRLE